MLRERVANRLCEMCLELRCLGETLTDRLTKRSTLPPDKGTNVTVSQLLNQSRALYGTQNFTTTIKTVYVVTPRLAELFNIIIPFNPRPSSFGFSSDLIKTMYVPWLSPIHSICPVHLTFLILTSQKCGLIKQICILQKIEYSPSRDKIQKCGRNSFQSMDGLL